MRTSAPQAGQMSASKLRTPTRKGKSGQHGVFDATLQSEKDPYYDSPPHSALAEGEGHWKKGQRSTRRESVDSGEERSK